MTIKELIKRINSINGYIEPMYIAIYDIKEEENNVNLYTFAIIAVNGYPVKPLFISSLKYDKNVSIERVEEEHLKVIIEKLSALAITHLIKTDGFISIT